MFLWFNFLKYSKCLHFKQMDCNHKIGGHHASKYGIIYSNGGHIGFNYTHTSLKGAFLIIKQCYTIHVPLAIPLYTKQQKEHSYNNNNINVELSLLQGKSKYCL